MNVYLDDIRVAPAGWWIVRSARQAVRLLKTGKVNAISLDHDLGEGKSAGCVVLDWIHKQVVLHHFCPPDIFIHTLNPVGKKKMEKVRALILQDWREKGK